MSRTRPLGWRGRSLCVLALMLTIGCDDGDGGGAGAAGGGPGAGAGGAGGGGVVQGPIECRDGVRDRAETDVDCGGPDCAGCLPGGACAETSDCLFGVCRAGICACPDGFELRDGLCVDTDECAAMACGPNATCTNLEGGVECTCLPGFLDMGAGCEDVDECMHAFACPGTDTLCRNLPGGFECGCVDGFEDTGDGCRDIDECAAGHACGPNATCLNAVGGVDCLCDAGYVEGEGGCVDEDECAVVDCGADSVCTNTPGGYDCSCAAGFRRLRGACFDIDECAEDVAGCGAGAQCTNRIGGFDCTCLPGFALGADGCVDVDECADDLDDCAENTLCTNTPGGFECGCADGYFQLPEGCFDVDECGPSFECLMMGINCEPQNSCDVRAICENTPGDYACACPPGFEGDGVDRSAGGTGCTAPPSCAALKARDPRLASGQYVIQPVGRPAIDVFCDMESDGGVGHTMLRLDRALPTGPNVQLAYRDVCTSVGLELIVPRTRSHLRAIIAYNRGDRPNLVGVFPREANAQGLGQYTGRCQGEPCAFYLSDTLDSGGCGVFEPSGEGVPESALHLTRRCAGAYGDSRDQTVEIGGYVLCSTNDGYVPRSCEDARALDALTNTTSGGIDGEYLIDPDGAGGADPYPAWCLQTAAGGGWTLAMQAAPQALAYDDPLWTNDALMPFEGFGFPGFPGLEGFPGLRPGTGKYRPFLDLPVGDVLLGFEMFDPNFQMLRPLAVLDAPPSLRALFADGGDIDPVGRAGWTQSLPFADLQPNCNAEGVNLATDAGQPVARLGIMGNNEDDCLTPDTVVGVGFHQPTVCPGSGTNQGSCRRGAGGAPVNAAIFVREPR